MLVFQNEPRLGRSILVEYFVESIASKKYRCYHGEQVPWPRWSFCKGKLNKRMNMRRVEIDDSDYWNGF